MTVFVGKNRKTKRDFLCLYWLLFCKNPDIRSQILKDISPNRTHDVKDGTPSTQFDTSSVMCIPEQRSLTLGLLSEGYLPETLPASVKYFAVLS